MRNSASHQRLATWFTQWSGPLRRWLGSRRRIASADLDDVTQEVFLRLLKYDRALIVESPQAYLFQVAANVANEWALKSRNRKPHSTKWLSDLSIEDHPIYEVMGDQARSRVTSALHNLPVRAREVLRLKYRDGLTNDEIAHQLKVHPQTVKRDLLLSYGRLRVDLSPELLTALERSREAP